MVLNETVTKLALHGGLPVRGEDRVWPSWPVWDDAERKALNEVLESEQWWYGDRVRAFEKAFAEFQHAASGRSCSPRAQAGDAPSVPFKHRLSRRQAASGDGAPSPQPI